MVLGEATKYSGVLLIIGVHTDRYRSASGSTTLHNDFTDSISSTRSLILPLGAINARIRGKYLESNCQIHDNYDGLPNTYTG